MKFFLVAGAVSVAATSPFFLTNFIKSYKKFRKYPKKKLYSAFYNLRKSGDIEIKKEGKQIYIGLSDKGKKKAGIFQIDALEIVKPAKWDEVWRVIIFDIGELKRIEREAFRGKLKQLGFYMLQKSAWLHPFDCFAEIDVLKGFFNLTDKEVRFFETKNIGEDKNLREFFNLN